MGSKAPSAIDKHVGSRVRLRRTIVGLSQTSLGETLGVTFQQVQKYEKGTNRIGASRLQEIANALSVPITFFYEGGPGQPSNDDAPPSDDILAQFVALPEAIPLMRGFVGLPSQDVRRNLVALVQAIGQAEGADEIEVTIPVANYG